ncbi:metallophosphoesterase family protein [Pacificoceanicola onchidii]|uniref:metallophosphoesterase family protein n=1 Tax=Pacificoceanicola onchidii TaxID=2562685 RepID=UPI0010A4B991|nr:metallophosphoesterase family protein [Pacificoceanicola onchidii]
MTRLYAIGDIHGQKSALEDQLALIDKDGGTQARVVFLGDYVDRGPDSKGVLDLFINGIKEGRDWVFLKGNHDRMFERFLDSGQTRDERILSGKLWLHERLGGTTTLETYLDTAAALEAIGAPTRRLESYGIDPMPDDLLLPFLSHVAEAVPQSHRDFLANLSLSHEEDGYFFVHAGIRPGLPLSLQEEDDMLWIRDEFLTDQRNHGALVVHGHTPVDAPEMRINRLNLDTGAGYGRALSTAVFEDGAVYHLNAFGRAAL